MTDYAIVLFHRDLRLHDNLAVKEAIDSGLPVVPLFVYDSPRPSSSQNLWLSRSLAALSASLQEFGVELVIRQGETIKALKELQKEKKGLARIYYNRSYDPARQATEEALASICEVESCSGALLYEPGQVLTKDGGFYKVFSAYWRACLKEEPLLENLHELKGQSWPQGPEFKSCSIEELQLHRSEISDENIDEWHIGEAAALQRLRFFLEKALPYYEECRDLPYMDGTSRLSPNLAFGEISPARIWREVQIWKKGQRNSSHRDSADKFLAELGWREFSYNILHFYPEILHKPYQEKFSKFPWEKDPAALRAWKVGMTGFPIVDAGMRQLLATGYMHNRVRMLVASFLVKDLFIHWKEGEDFFWQLLVDSDPANNPCSWQWVAGSGFDAAPYFRIFNPVLQGKKFDPEGEYVKRWVPELAKLHKKYVHCPWEAPAELCPDYPEPMVDHGAMRQKALEAFSNLEG